MKKELILLGVLMMFAMTLKKDEEGGRLKWV